MRSTETALVWFVALYPPVVAAMWIAGVVFRLLGLEALASLVWALAFGVTIAVAAAALAVPSGKTLGDVGIAWGVAVAVVATLQAAFALAIGARYDRLALTALLVAPLYTVAFWMLNAAAAIRAEAPAMVRGPTERRVVWDIPPQRSDAGGEPL